MYISYENVFQDKSIHIIFKLNNLIFLIIYISNIGQTTISPCCFRLYLIIIV